MSSEDTMKSLGLELQKKIIDSVKGSFWDKHPRQKVIVSALHS